MSTFETEVSARTNRTPATIALALAAVLLVLAMVSALGVRWGLWSFATAVSLLGMTAYGAIAVGVFAAAVLFLSMRKHAKTNMLLATAALVASIVTVAVPLQYRARLRHAAPIHDVSTDTDNPPQFLAVAPLRTGAANPVAYGGPAVAASQRTAYPDLRPLVLDLSHERAFQRSLDTARSLGWEIVANDPKAGIIEATDRTFWFGLRDDIVVRVTPTGMRSIVDVRASSRDGTGDGGRNAKRIREFLRRVAD